MSRTMTSYLQQARTAWWWRAYFPPESIRRQYFKPSSHSSVCPREGVASYYDMRSMAGQSQRCLVLPEPKDAARQIKGRVAFWKAVRVES
jgi:uncharacterized protein (DUF427 family)